MLCVCYVLGQQPRLDSSQTLSNLNSDWLHTSIAVVTLDFDPLTSIHTHRKCWRPEKQATNQQVLDFNHVLWGVPTKGCFILGVELLAEAICITLLGVTQNSHDSMLR